MKNDDNPYVARGRELFEQVTFDVDGIIDDVLVANAAGLYDEHPDEWVRRLEPIDLSGEASTNIARVEYVGDDETHDIEVDHTDHQFVLSNGILTSNSHAVAYAIDSYLCSWLLVKHEEQWLCAYLESYSNNPDDRAEAFAQVKSMGYEVVGIDINEATHSWTILPGKRFMPSFLSCKGIGAAAADEIIANRPYRTIEELLWTDSGEWRHSKFNKRALEALIRIGGLRSLDCVGPEKLFSSCRHMHHVLIENGDKVKKTSKRDPHVGRKNMYAIARETFDEYAEEWSRRELVEFQVEYFGSVDVLALLGPELIQKLAEKGVPSVDKVEQGEKVIAWFVVQDVKLKKTKTGKTYAELEGLVPSGKLCKIKCWGVKPDYTVEPFTVCLAEVNRDEWGFSTSSFKLKKLGA